jgi:hypothetical protein
VIRGALALVTPLLAAQGEEASPPPRLALTSVEAPAVTLFYVTLPWAPYTFDEMERPGDSFYNKRAWPFARLSTAAPLELEGTRIPAGNYALVLHPNTPENRGLHLELRRIQVAEFLEPGNALTPAPEGETLWRGPIRFERDERVAPALELELLPAPEAVSLLIRYGDRRLTKTLRH